MSTIPKPPIPAQSTAPRPAPAPIRKQETAKHSVQPQEFLFDKENYMWMLGGLALIFIGFFLMTGGKSANPNEFNYEEIYSFRRITLAPIIVLLGFGIQVYAIMKKPKETAEVAKETIPGA